MIRPPDFAVPGLLIRPMLAADLSTVVRIERTTPRAPHWSLEDYRNCLEASSEHLQRRAWIAECSDGILGFAVVSGVPVGPRLEFELESLVIRPQDQRRGVGSTLLATVIRVLNSSGASILTLEVRASNVAAIRLYEAFGFTRTGLRKAYYGGRDGTPPEDAVLMQQGL